MFPGGSLDEGMGQGEKRPSRLRSLAFGGVALLSVAGLAFGLTRVFGTAPPGRSLFENPSEASAPASPPRGEAAASRDDALGSLGEVRTSSLEAAEGAGAPSSTPGARDPSGDGTPRPSARATPRRVSALLDKLAERRAAIRAEPRRTGRVTSRADTRGAAAGFAPGTPQASPSAVDPAPTPESQSEPGAATEDTPRTPYTPGYAEVAGVEVRTPAHAAGIRRGDRILEYNGIPVEGRTALERAWAEPGQGAAVPVLVEDGRTGRVREVYVPPGNFGIVQPPANRP